MGRLFYRKGPLGYAVFLDGKPWGSIKDRSPRGWQVNVPALNYAPRPIAGATLYRGLPVFPTLAAAKAAVAAMVGRGA